MNINKSNEVLGSRKKMTLTLDVKNSLQNSVTSYLSMAVRDLKAVPHNTNSENIKTWLLLNSDLRGEIESPGYFFEKENDVKRKYLLDLVMLTHGWRRFTWEELFNNKTAEKTYETEKGIRIMGTVKRLKKPYTLLSSPVRLTFFDKIIHQETQMANAEGKFNFGPFIFKDTISTLVESRITDFKTTTKKDREVLILVDKDPIGPKVDRTIVLKGKNSQAQIESYKKMTKYLQQVENEYLANSRLLDEVVIKAKKREETDLLEEERNSRTNYGFPTSRAVVDENTNAFSVLDLISQLTGVFVRGDSVYVRNRIPDLYLDNMQIDYDILGSLSVNDISFVDLLRGADAATFANASNGVIALYSNLGSNISSKLAKRSPGIIDFYSKGFYVARKFYAPDHINGTEELLKADIRTTLHWEPKIKITPDKKAEITFFTSDSKGNYIIEVEGISAKGTPVQAISTFTVQ